MNHEPLTSVSASRLEQLPGQISKGMTMARTQWALCRANRHLAPAPAINLREVQQTIAAVDEAIEEAELRNQG